MGGESLSGWGVGVFNVYTTSERDVGWGSGGARSFLGGRKWRFTLAFTMVFLVKWGFE